MRLRSTLLSAAGTAALLLVVAPAAAAPRSYVVTIDKLKFGPFPSGLHKGDKILWVNRDILRHTATATNHSFDVDLQPGAKSLTVLKSAGLISVFCRYHPGMRGVLSVK
jgi:plastocyanin